MRLGTTMWSLVVTWPKPSASAWRAIESNPSALPVMPRVNRLTPKSIARPFPSLGPRLAALELTNKISHRRRGLVVALLSQAFGGALPVGRGAVLAHLPLPDQPYHRHFNSNDGAELLVDEVGRRVRDLPGIASPCLVSIRELLDEVPQPVSIVDDAQW